MADYLDLATILGRQDTTPEMLNINNKDRQILRQFAAEVAELASRPRESQLRELWYRHNALEDTRPLVLCFPENSWKEIFNTIELKCEGELARRWEITLHMELFHANHLKDDRVVEPFFNIAHIYEGSDWGLETMKIGGEEGGSFIWDAPLKDYRMLDQLRIPSITIDTELTNGVFQLAEETLGDILKVRIKNSWLWTVGLTITTVYLRGLEQMMLDMIDQPENLHKLMGFIHDGYLARLEFLEANHLLSLNNDGSYCGSGGYGWSKELPKPDFNGHVRLQDQWGFAESQETVGISPGMFAEFIFPYQLDLLKRFGLTYYGCCEPLDKRWSIIQEIPNLRRVSVSPWAHREKMAEMLGDRYIYAMKPIPTDLAMDTFDEDKIRKEIRGDLKTTRDCHVEVIMKDTHTVRNDPNRLVRWVQIVKEEAENI